MSKGFSNLFGKTRGGNFGAGTVKSRQNAAAIEAANALIKSMRPKDAKRINTVAIVYDEKSGQSFVGYNKGLALKGQAKNPTLFGDDTTKGLLPKASLNNFPLGNCAEVDAVNQALNFGCRIENLHLFTIHVTKGKFGKPKPSCENCTHAFRGVVKSNHSGWKEGK